MPDPLPFADSEEVLPCDGSAVLYTGVLTDEPFFALLQEEVVWQQHHLTMFGRTVAEPRRSAWFGDPGISYAYSGRSRLPLAWTPTMAGLRSRCEQLAGTTFNGCLANLYRNGGDHMGWHADDEPALGDEPVIASVSLGAERFLDFRHRTSGRKIRIALPHGSILVMSGLSQREWHHRVPKQVSVKSPRINLTFRHLLWGS